MCFIFPLRSAHRDREQVLKKIIAQFELEQKLKSSLGYDHVETIASRNWTLVATSCVEAGVDLSFQIAYRESASVFSAIQVGGRVNRHNERSQGVVISFRILSDQFVNHHPDFKISSRILDKSLLRGDFETLSPAALSTRAMKMELKELASSGGKPLEDAEEKNDYPLVAELGKVIDSDTRLVVVCKTLLERFESGDRPSFNDLQKGSVQIWSPKIKNLGLAPVKGFPNIYIWSGPYDSDFTGIMDGLLKQIPFENGGGVI